MMKTVWLGFKRDVTNPEAAAVLSLIPRLIFQGKEDPL
jgi:hypothetical protein